MPLTLQVATSVVRQGMMQVVAHVTAQATPPIRIFCNAATATATWISHTTVCRTVGPFALTISPQAPGLLLVSTLLGTSALPPEVARGLA